MPPRPAAELSEAAARPPGLQAPQFALEGVFEVVALEDAASGMADDGEALRNRSRFRVAACWCDVGRSLPESSKRGGSKNPAPEFNSSYYPNKQPSLK
jgi:hypothetical protein